MNEKDLKPGNIFLGCQRGKVKTWFVKPIVSSRPSDPHTEKSRKDGKERPHESGQRKSALLRGIG